MEKLTNEEQEKFQFIKKGIINNFFELGKIIFDIENIKKVEIELELNKRNVIDTLNNLDKQEEEFQNLLRNKYGENKSIDPETYEIK